MNQLDPFLLELIACPQCQGALAASAKHLDCGRCSLRFPIVDGIPVLLVDEAQALPATTNDEATA